jgi:lipid-A-disaccharide synthase
MEKIIKRVWIIAGEASGDALGAGLLHELKNLAKDAGQPLELAGIGGPLMAAEGINSLFPMVELSIMGFVEVLRHAPRVMRRLRETAEAITRFQPDVIITMDSYGFHSRLYRRLPRLLGKRLHYVAPTVWVYRPKRAQDLQQWVDELLTLFPFEPPYFEKVGLKSTYIGHPLATMPVPSTQAVTTFCAAYPGALLLGVMPGSRRGEIIRMWPIYAEAIKKIHVHFPQLSVCIPVLQHTKMIVQELAAPLPCPVILVEGAERRTALAALDFALTKSGTITLELALLGVPMVVAHRVNPISAWLLRRMVKIPSVSLPNILLKKEMIQELLQERCTPENIVQTLLPLLQDQQTHTNARADAKVLANLLAGSNPSRTPNQQAAQRVWEWLEPS